MQQKRYHNHRTLAAGVALLFLATGFSAGLAQTLPDLPDLYYLVVDQSGSIAENRLTEPVKREISEFVREIPENTRVDLVFFSGTATRPRTWYPMDERGKADLARYFDQNFKPGGRTRLYDTVAEVVQRVAAIERDHRAINIMILSDGVDNQSRRHRNWASVESLVPEHWTRIPGYEQRHRVLLLTLEYEPPPGHRPSPDGPVQMTPRLRPEDLRGWMLPPPSAKFTAHPLKLRAGESVMFMLDAPIGVSSVRWFLGDGTQSDLFAFTHTYKTEGVYDVRAEVEGAGGLTDSIGRPGYIHVVQDVPLGARFSWHPKAPRVGDSVILTDESSGGPTSWNWILPGQPPRTERNPTVTFSSAGRQKVVLTVSTTSESRSFTNEIPVLPPLPDARFTPSRLELPFGDILELNAAASEPGWTHRWTLAEEIELEGSTVQWQADRAGRIDVVHAVSGPGGMVEHVVAVVVGEPAEDLVAQFNFSPREVRVADPVQFVDESMGSPRVWRWEIEGREPIEERNPSFTFQEAGPVRVQLFIEREGRKDDCEEEIQVLPALTRLQAAFSVNRKRGRIPFSVQFKDQSRGEIAAWHWEFGDGQTSDLQHPLHTYEEVRSYRPRLTVRDSLGEEARDAGATDLTAQPPPPIWIRFLGYAVGLLVSWGLLARLLLAPMILPGKQSGKTVLLRSATGVYPIHRLARSKSSWLWPRSYLRIGSDSKADIKISFPDGARVESAAIRRAIGSSAHRLEPRPNGRVQIAAESRDPMTGRATTIWSDTKAPVSLRNGVKFRVGNTEFEWSQK